MLQAYVIAQESPDLSTQNSALLIHPQSGQILCGAVNYQLGHVEHPERLQRPLKYKYTAHAEASVCLMAARAGIKTTGLIMFAPWAACIDCARCIILAGIKEVWTHELVSAHNQWSAEVKDGIALLREHSVVIHIIKDRLDPSGKTTIRRNEQLVPV